ncbi:MAG: aminodeoxychorismate/anthranilate synthase component II [Candidatus Woesearchaeota archaeon]|nr:aminodeoxychorismate/anthranilate synthase component II [Candidatus Woesearchaeota archaeon]
MTKILFIDNYDSFANIIAAYFANAGADVAMLKSDSTMSAIAGQKKDLIVLGPGPNSPKEAGNYLEIIRKYHKDVPLFGICLGHQCIIDYFKESVHPLNEPAHGVSASMRHDGKTIFEQVANPAMFARYHSLGIYANEIPKQLEISACMIPKELEKKLKEEGISIELEDLVKLNAVVMGVRHRQYPIEGVQFHPESVLSDSDGLKLIKNVLKYLGGEKCLKRS